MNKQITQQEIDIHDNKFSYLDKEIDCRTAIKNDIAVIKREAMESHRDFNRLYDTSSIVPQRVRIFLMDDILLYCMIIYTIQYKDSNNGRYACGNYYPFYDRGETMFVSPHPYQGSICW